MALPTVVYLYPKNTQVVSVLGLQDVVTQQYLNSAQVTMTLLDDRGNPDPVLNQLAMSYEDGSNGNYQGTVPATFQPSAWKASSKQLNGYTLQIVAVQAGVQSVFSLPAIITLRAN